MAEGRISEKEYVEAVSVHQSRYTRPVLIACASLSAVAIVLWFAGVRPAFAATVFGAGIGGAIGHWIWDRRLVPARAVKLYRQSGDFAMPMHVTWDATGVEIRSEKGSWRMSWAEFAKRRESEMMTLLYINDQMFNIFPRSLYCDDDEWQSFREAASRVPT